MTNYPTKYLFIAETQGIKRAAADLNTLAAAMSKVNASSGGGSAGGGSSSFGPGKTAARDWDGLGGYVEKFGHRMRSALAYSLAFGAIGATFGAIGASVRTWVDAQVQLNDVIANTAILLGRTAQEGEQFANVQRSLAFATGQSLTELAPASMMAERVGQPELAVSAAQWSMVVGPQLNASETVDDLRALSIQFGISMGEINNSLLATLQNSGIAADQLFDLSASFGVFAGQLGLGETERDLREIAGLFAALSNITGQTTPTLQNFVRRMADEFYDPNAALRQQLEAAGIRTVSAGPKTTSRDVYGNVTVTSEEIRRPFNEIFAEIAIKGPAAIKAFSTAIDNSLGQPTQSQFILVAENWDKVREIIDDTTQSVADFGNAVKTAGEKTSTGLGQIAAATHNLFSAIGDGEGFAKAVRTIAAAIQNVYDVTRDPDAGMMRLPRGGELNGILDSARGRELENTLESAYGDNTGNEPMQRRLWEMLRVVEVPMGLNQFQRQEYALNAASQFAGSDFVRRGDVGAVGAQQFQAFLRSEDFSVAQALEAVFGESLRNFSVEKAFSGIITQAEALSLRAESLGTNVPDMLAEIDAANQRWAEAATVGRDVVAEMGPLASSASYAEGQLLNLASAAGAASGSVRAFQDLKQFRLPEGYGLAEFDKFYEEAGVIMDTFNQGGGPVQYLPGKFDAVGVTNSYGIPLGAPNYAEDQAALALQLANQDKQAQDKALSEQKSYQSKALAVQEAYQNKMLGAWNGMINDLLQPSAVTGTDLFYNSPRGTYNDNWDEPVRRMKADINNAIGGKPLEYGYGGLTPYMNMDAVAMAMASETPVKEAILRSEEARVSEQFYNMELPWEAYSGNTDAIVANAQAWIARKQQKNANMANVQQLLIDAGLGPDAEAFVKAMEEPPILQALFGGKSSDEINTAVTDAVTPDMTTALAKQAANTSWSLTIATAIQNDVTNNYEVVVSAGAVIGSALAKGSAAQFAAAIIPLVLAAITGRE